MINMKLQTIFLESKTQIKIFTSFLRQITINLIGFQNNKSTFVPYLTDDPVFLSFEKGKKYTFS